MRRATPRRRVHWQQDSDVHASVDLHALVRTMSSVATFLVAPSGRYAASRFRSQLITPPASSRSTWRGERSWRRPIVRRAPSGGHERGGELALPGSQRPVHAGEPDHVALRDPVVVGRVGEGQRQDAEIGQVLPVDAGEAPGQHHAQAEVARRERGVLAARALPVVVAGDDGVAACRRRAPPARAGDRSRPPSRTRSRPTARCCSRRAAPACRPARCRRSRCRPRP